MTNCKDKTLKIILSRPVTLSDILANVDCVYETVNRHLVDLECKGKISSKKSKFSIFHKPELEFEKIDFFELMLNSTLKSTILLMLKSSDLNQSEICSIVGKSPPSISRTLKSLIKRNIVETHYNSPGKTYSLKNKFLIISWMRDTHPGLFNSMTDSLVEMLS